MIKEELEIIEKYYKNEAPEVIYKIKKIKEEMHEKIQLLKNEATKIFNEMKQLELEKNKTEEEKEYYKICVNHFYSIIDLIRYGILKYCRNNKEAEEQTKEFLRSLEESVK